MIIAEASRAAREAGANPIDRLHALLREDVEATDRLIHERMGSSATLIPDLAKYLVDSGGKRLRPLLTLAAATACGHAGAMHIKLAAAVEFIHTATLLHDDVVDASSLRRGKLSANMVWGNKPSILVGDFLLSRAFQLMVETGDMRVLHILANASAVIAEGEVMQIDQQSESDPQQGIGDIAHTAAVADAHDQAHRYARQACRALQTLSHSALNEALMAVAEFCVARAY